MAGDVIKMVIQLDDKASPGLKKVEKSTASAGKASVKSAKGFKMSGASLAKMGAVALAAAAAFGKMIQALADSRNELIDTATRTGLATDTIAGLRLAAEGSGLGFTTLAAGLQQLPKRMSDMANGTGEAKKAFEFLGVSVLEASGEMRSADDVLKESLSKILAIESPTQKAALATELFGRSGTSMLQALSGTELQDFVDQAERFGVSVGPAAAKAAGDFQRELATFGMVTEKANETFISAFGSGPGGAGNALKGFGAILLGLVSIFKNVMDSGRKSFGVLTNIITDLFMAMMDLGEALGEALSGNIFKAGKIADKAWANLTRGMTQTAEQAGEVMADAISFKAIREGVAEGLAFFDTATAGTGGSGKRQKFTAPTGAEDGDKKAPGKADTGEQITAEDWAKAVPQITASVAEMSASLTALPYQLAAGVLDGMAAPVQAMTSMMGPAGGVLSSLAAMGGKGAKAIKAELKGFIKNIITALVDVLPDVLVDLPVILVNAIPRLVGGLIKAIPRLIGALVFKLPIAIFKGVGMWFVKAWKMIKAALAELNPFKKKGGIFTPQKTAGRARLAVATLGVSEVIRAFKGLFKGGKLTGGFTTGGTGLYMLHQGERVIPSTGASTSAMMAAAGNIGSGQTINISTNVVDPNALESLGRLLDRQFGERGRSRAGIFSNAEPLGGLI